MFRSTTIRARLALGLSTAMLAAPAAFAEKARQPAGHQEVTVEFRYQPWVSPAENYGAIRRLVTKACTNPSVLPLALKLPQQVCVREMLDKSVAQLGRKQIADLHFAATGRHVAQTQLASAER